MTPGYLLGDGGVTKATDDNDWLHTGDVVVMNELGYIDITDRIKDMYIVGGFNAYPAEIERMMVEHPDIELPVIGVPEARLGEVGAAFVAEPLAAPSPKKPSSSGAARKWQPQGPRHVWFVDTLPLTRRTKCRSLCFVSTAERMA